MYEGNRRDRDPQLRGLSRRGGFQRRAGVVLLVVVVALSSTGCATVVQLTHYPEPPQIFGGVRTYDDLYEDLGYVNAHGIASGLDFLVGFFALDLVATIALDLVLLPLTIPTEIAHARRHDEDPEWSP